jgi:rod shape-determining protein MreD
MAMMYSYSSRRDVQVRSLPLPVYLLAPVIALGLQSFISLHFQRFDLLDLPLLFTLYFATIRRNPIVGTLAGAIIGIAQDALTQHALGVFGICKSIIGYLAASLGARIDVESQGTRLLLGFVFTLLHSCIFWVVVHRLLAQAVAFHWIHELIRAIVNALVGVVLFSLLDRTQRRD